jgi:hypothetical protein
MHNRMLIAGALAAILLAVPDAIAQTAAPDGVWTAKKPLPVARNEVALAATGGKLRISAMDVGVRFSSNFRYAGRLA